MAAPTKPAATLRLNNRGRSQKVAEIVAQSIAEYILNEGLMPGDALPNEKVMTESLAVARSTLREGLRLQHDGPITCGSERDAITNPKPERSPKLGEDK